MATDADFLQFVLDQLAGTPGITHRKMFGQYALYRHGKVVAFLCDNQCFPKPTEAGRALLDPGVDGFPYPGACPGRCKSEPPGMRMKSWTTWRVVHVFIRGSASRRAALHQADITF